MYTGFPPCTATVAFFDAGPYVLFNAVSEQEFVLLNTF
jgi:hypothetical protein